MSLRYKALIATVLLVAVLTGVLVWRAGRSYEDAERLRISRQLHDDARNLGDVLDARAQVAGNTLKFAAQGAEVVRLVGSGIPVRDNFAPWAREWAEAADADVTLAAIESFTAQDREAQILHRGPELCTVAIHVRPGFVVDRPQLLADWELNARLARAFHEAETAVAARRAAGKAAPAESMPLVLGIGGRVYLCVIAPLYESLQDFTVIGAAAALIELSSEWLKQNFRASGSSDNPDDAGTAAGIFKVVYVGDTPTASTWEPMEEAAHVFRSAPASGVFGFNLESVGDRFLGLRMAFDLAPRDLAQRPGFIPFKNLDDELKPLNRLRQDISLLGLTLGVLASLLAYLTAYSVIRRIRRLQSATVAVREGKFDTRVEVRGRDELSSLSKAFNDMTTGLKALGLYTHETLARSVLDNPGTLGEVSARHEGSVFFSDVKGFTTIAEEMGADELTAQLNEYFAALGRVLRDSRGYVDKFIGDGIMAFWGRPFVREDDYAARACRSALACIKAGVELRAKWLAEGKPLFFQRIGVATGEVVVGNIGTETKKNFTVIGDPVNLASRLEGANKVYGTEALVDKRTAELASGAVLFREVDQLRVVGKSEPVRVFEPLALLGHDTGPVRLWVALYEQALAAYRARDFAAALTRLEDLEDGPSQWLAARCRVLLGSGLPPGWQPVTEATAK